MKVGMTKDQGLYNKPSAAVQPGALAAGATIQYNTIQCIEGISAKLKVILTDISRSSRQCLQISGANQ